MTIGRAGHVRVRGASPRPPRSRPSPACARRAAPAANGSPATRASSTLASAAGPPSTATGRMPQPSSISSRIAAVGRRCRRRSGPAGPAAARPRRRWPRSRPAGATAKRAVKWNVLPSPGVALDPDPAAHQLDQVRRDGQAEPGAAVAAASSTCRPARTASKSRSSFVRRDADAGVADGEVQRRQRRRSTRAPPRPRRTTSPRSVNLMRVADQVDEHLAQAPRVADEARPGTSGAIVGRPARAPCWCARTASGFERVVERRSREVELDRLRARACRPRSWRSRGCR